MNTLQKSNSLILRFLKSQSKLQSGKFYLAKALKTYVPKSILLNYYHLRVASLNLPQSLKEMSLDYFKNEGNYRSGNKFCNITCIENPSNNLFISGHFSKFGASKA